MHALAHAHARVHAHTYMRVCAHTHHFHSENKITKQLQTVGNFTCFIQVKSSCGGFFSHHAGAVTQTNKYDGSLKENGHIGTTNGGNKHLSVRRLLSSTSSYTYSITPEERELREVAMT
jgi:hypothetical protein